MTVFAEDDPASMKRAQCRVQKTLNFSYEPYPDISNFPTFSGTRQPDLGAKSNYFATKKTEKKIEIVWGSCETWMSLIV